MSLGNLNFDDITEVNLNELIEVGVPEGFKIEYKSQLYGNSHSDKKEALKDISSFGNAFGGHLIIGMEETEGLPTAIKALEGINPDAEILRLESLARDGIEPRITGIRVRAVNISSGGHVIIIRIPKSWNPPHRVSARNINRFYVRNSAGSHEVSVEELRALFNLSSTISEKIAAFRSERLALLSVDEGPIKIVHNGVLILHIVPFSAFSSHNIIDISQVFKHQNLFKPLGNIGSYTDRFNFDGFMNYRGEPDCHGYTQVFRSGVIESTMSSMLLNTKHHGKALSVGRLGSVFKSLPMFFEGLKRLNVSPPLVIMISLQAIQGSLLYKPDVIVDDWICRFDKPDLLLPEVIINDYANEANLQRLMRPAFDTLWNAGGYAESDLFDDNNLWI